MIASFDTIAGRDRVQERGEGLSERKGETSAHRVLNLLEYFSRDAPIWTVGQLMEREGAAKATLYRYLSALVAKGFLTQVARGAYALGPRIIELDRQIRVGDPLLRIAAPLMAEVREQVLGTQLLCRYYGARVMSIYEDRSDPRIVTSFDRGKPFPLFSGSPSRSILANLPAAQLQKIFSNYADEIARANLGRSWQSFRENMKTARDERVVVASDIDRDLIGFGCPIFSSTDTVTASITLARMRNEVGPTEIEQLSTLAIRVGDRISEALRRFNA